MTALDTNVLVRYLVDDHPEQASAARALLEGLTADRPGFICREVVVELVWVLQRTYRVPHDQIAAALEALVATESIVVEAANDVARAAARYRQGGAGFSDLMIVAAAERSQASPLYTFDRTLAQVEGAVLLSTTTA